MANEASIIFEVPNTFVLYASTDLNVMGGDYFGPKILEIWGCPKKISSSKKSNDKVLAKKLWELSEIQTSVKFKI